MSDMGWAFVTGQSREYYEGPCDVGAVKQLCPTAPAKTTDIVDNDRIPEKNVLVKRQPKTQQGVTPRRKQIRKNRATYRFSVKLTQN